MSLTTGTSPPFLSVLAADLSECGKVRTMLRRETSWALSEHLVKLQSPGPHPEKLLLTGRGTLSTSVVSTASLKNQPPSA